MMQHSQMRLQILAGDVFRRSRSVTSHLSYIPFQDSEKQSNAEYRNPTTADHIIRSPSSPTISWLQALGADARTNFSTRQCTWPEGLPVRYSSTSSSHSNHSLLSSEAHLPAAVDPSAPSSKTCEHFECIRRPKYEIEGAAVGRFCKQHSKPGMVQIHQPIKTCEFEGCESRQAHGVTSASGIGYCKVHNKPGMAVPLPVALSTKSQTRKKHDVKPSHASLSQDSSTSPSTADSSSSSSDAVSAAGGAAEEKVKPRWALERAAFQKELLSFSGESGVLAAQREAAAEEAWLAAEQAAKQYHLPAAVVETMEAASLLLGLDPAELATLTQGLSHLCRHIPQNQHDVWAAPQQSMDELVLVLQGVPLTHDKIKAALLEHPSLLLAWKKEGSSPAARAGELRSALGLTVASFDDLMYNAPQVLADTPEEVAARLSYIGTFFMSAGAAVTPADALQDHVLPLVSSLPLLAAVPTRALRAIAVTTNSAGIPFRALAAAVVADSKLLMRGAPHLTAQLQNLADARLTVLDIALCPALLVRDFTTVVGPRLAYASRVGTVVVAPSECKRLQDTLAVAVSELDPPAVFTQEGTALSVAAAASDMALALNDRSCWADKQVVTLSYLLDASSEELCSTLGYSLEEFLASETEWQVKESAKPQQIETQQKQTGRTLKEALSGVHR